MRIIVLVILSTILFVTSVYAFSDSEIANAIYLAEGGSHSHYAYGIKSVHYRDIDEAFGYVLPSIG